jgi:exoribonuclease II
VRVRITGTDALTLDVHANLLARLDGEAASTLAEEDDSEAVDASPLALAIDLNEPEAAAPLAS